MYICADCGGRFEEPKASKEQMGEFWGVPAYETFYVCPNCGSTDYDEGVECPVCGELFVDDDADECPLCMERISHHMHALKDKYDIDMDTLGQWIADFFGW